MTFNMLKDYYELTKPGIVYGNLMTATVGFLLASGWHINFELLVATLVGIGSVMASGCVFNNYIDRDIDALMERTKERVLARDMLPKSHALVYGVILGVLGELTLFVFVNTLAGVVAFVGFFVYVGLYSLWTKRTTFYGTIVGSVAGAVPPVVGYVAVMNVLDVSAFALFAVLVFWQMAHSYAIAIYRLRDYAQANIPVLPLKKGTAVAKRDIVVYTVCTVVAMLSFVFIGNLGIWYGVVIGVTGGAWIVFATQGFSAMNDHIWSRQMLLASLVVLVVWCVALSANFL